MIVRGLICLAMIVALATGGGAARGQGMTYQGQLKSSGVPTSGTFGMSFHLYATKTGGAPLQSAVESVEVVQGLFSIELPFDPLLFDGSDRFLEIVVEGVPLTPRQLVTYAPYAAHAFGGGSLWSANTGGIDYTGGRVGIGTTDPTGLLHVYGKSLTGTSSLDQQQQVAGLSLSTVDVWQSFTPGQSGLLISLSLHLRSPVAGNDRAAVLRIYVGEGTAGQQLTEQPVTLQDTGAATWQNFPVGAAPMLTAGQVYTIRLTTALSLGPWLSAADGNPYPGGRLDSLPTSDLMFRTYMNAGTDNTMLLVASGRVGVGTAVPEATLHVDGPTRASYFQSPGSTATDRGARLLTGGAGGHTITFQTDAFGAVRIVNEETDGFKTFIINHPVAADRYLVHATVEGPEVAVFYRGTAELRNGRAKVTLPEYFESLTLPEARTIQLTNLDGFDRLAVKRIDGRQIRNGAFEVIAENAGSNQAFNWEVKAQRRDSGLLAVEPSRGEIEVAGDGPYRYARPKRSEQASIGSCDAPGATAAAAAP